MPPPGTCGKSGQTAYDVATLNGHHEIAEFLKQGSTKSTNSKDQSKETESHSSVISDLLKSFEELRSEVLEKIHFENYHFIAF